MVKQLKQPITVFFEDYENYILIDFLLINPIQITFKLTILHVNKIKKKINLQSKEEKKKRHSIKSLSQNCLEVVSPNCLHLMTER